MRPRALFAEEPAIAPPHISPRLIFSGSGTPFTADFTTGIKIVGKSPLSVLKPLEKSELVRQLARSGAGRGRRGTAKPGEPPSNIVYDTCELPEGTPSDFDLLREQAAKDGPQSPLGKILTVRAHIRAHTRADGRPTVPFHEPAGGCIRAFRAGETMAGYHPDTLGNQRRQVSHDTPEPDVDMQLNFRATREHRYGAPEVKDHQRASLSVHCGERYIGFPVSMGAMQTSDKLTAQHRPSACPCPRLSFIDDLGKDYDDESERVWNEEIDRARAEWGVTEEDDASAWEWPDVEWHLGGKPGAECPCSYADLDPATRMRIQASAAKTREMTYGDGSEAMAAVTGRSAAEIEREMNCSRDVVRAWCTHMLAQLSKAETGTARRKSHGAGRHLDWTELVTSHPSELRALADELHRAHEAGETPSQCGGAHGSAPPDPAPALAPPTPDSTQPRCVLTRLAQHPHAHTPHTTLGSCVCSHHVQGMRRQRERRRDLPCVEYDALLAR